MKRAHTNNQATKTSKQGQLTRKEDTVKNVRRNGGREGKERERGGQLPDQQRKKEKEKKMNPINRQQGSEETESQKEAPFLHKKRSTIRFVQTVRIMSMSNEEQKR